MATLQSLREEHRDLLPHIERLRDLADHAGDLESGELARRIAEAHDFLTGHLLRHARAEERVLYPEVGRVLGAAQATATMSRDHVEVERLTGELGELRDLPAYTAGHRRTLQRVLYGLYALAGVHFAKEEEVYLPLLEDRLSQEDADGMIAAMHRAAHE